MNLLKLGKSYDFHIVVRILMIYVPYIILFQLVGIYQKIKKATKFYFR